MTLFSFVVGFIAGMFFIAWGVKKSLIDHARDGTLFVDRFRIIDEDRQG